MVEDVALIGPWAKIADEVQRWRQTVITTFLVSCDLRLLERVTGLALTDHQGAVARRSPRRRSCAVAPPRVNSASLAAVK